MKKRYWIWAGIALVAIFLIVAGVWIARVYRTTRSLWDTLNEARALADGDPMQVLRDDPDSIGAMIYGAREDIVALKRQVGWLAKLGPAFRWLPKVGPLLKDAPAYLTLADTMSEVGVVLWEQFSPALVVLQGQADTEMAATEVIARTLEAAVPNLAPAQVAAQEAQAAYAQLDIAALPGQVQDPVRLLGELLPLLNDGLAFAEVAPQLLGVDAPRTYLVLGVNETELRPIGGLITALAEVHIQAGQILTMTFHDSYAVDDFSRPYPTPPEPIQRFLAIDLWVFRDSNWSPDFPTAVRQGADLYRPKHPVTLDGVILLDLWAVQQVIEALEPVRVPGFDQPLRGETVIPYIYELWAPEGGEFTGEWWRERKSFMGPLGMAVLDRVQAGDADWLKLGHTVMRLLEEKHLLLYMDNAKAEALLLERGWGGGLRDPKGDYLMVVEANLGFNKVSANIERAFEYHVDLSTSGLDPSAAPQADLTLVYTNTSTREYPCTPESRYDADYEKMMERCYWNALRVFVPEGAQLVEASQHPIPAESVASGEAWDGVAYATDAVEGAYTTFHQAFVLPTGSTTTVKMTYTLPRDVVIQQDNGMYVYHLDFQKQAGLRTVPARVVLRLPQNAVLLSAQPPPLSVADGVLLFNTDLRVDRQIVVKYNFEK